MPELIAKSALDGRRATIGTVTLAEAEVGQITSVALFPGGAKAAAKGLKTLGLTFPAPNAMSEKAGVRILWTGRDQAFVLGAVPEVDCAAVTDQSDGWTCLAVEGDRAGDVLARLLPLDLRLAAFPAGTVARTLLNHMNAVVMRPDTNRFEVLVFRSMARSAWHEIEAAMMTVAARG